MAQQGGVDWLSEHLRLNGFDPDRIDGRDPAAFAWAILEMEGALGRPARPIAGGEPRYPVPLHYGIAEAPRGTASTARAPTRAQPAARRQSRGATPPRASTSTRRAATVGAACGARRPRCADSGPHESHSSVRGSATMRSRCRDVSSACDLPEPDWRPPGGPARSPMAAIDTHLRRHRARQPAAAATRRQPGRDAQQPHGRHARPAQAPRHRRRKPGVAEAVRRRGHHRAERGGRRQRGARQQGRHQSGGHLRGLRASRCSAPPPGDDLRRHHARGRPPAGLAVGAARRSPRTPGRTARTSSRTRIRRWPRPCSARCPTSRACCSRSTRTARSPRCARPTPRTASTGPWSCRSGRWPTG